MFLAVSFFITRWIS